MRGGCAFRDGYGMSSAVQVSVQGKGRFMREGMCSGGFSFFYLFGFLVSGWQTPVGDHQRGSQA
jgi:hypothetical protein